MTAKEFLRSKGISADLKTLRLTTRVEDGLIVDWMDEYANQRVVEELQGLKFKAVDSSQGYCILLEDLSNLIKELKQ